MPERRDYYWIPLVIAASVALGIFIGGKLRFHDTPEKLFTTNSKKDKLNRLIDYIDYEYVDDVNTDSIVDVTVNNILDKLDPHSVYIPKKEMQRESENMKGDFVGIGVSFYMYKDTLAVIRSIEGGPSEEAGIRQGDRILFADEDTLFGKNLRSEAIVSRLKGKPDTPVSLGIYRKGTDDIFNVTVKRTHVPIKSVDAFYMLNDRMGYIKINRFAESTYREFKQALTFLKQEGATEMVLDLRDNPGGYLGIAEQISDEFLEDNKLILFTKNKKGTIEKSFATRKGDFENGYVYVLINEKSASASEIIAGALQDNDKGTIVGRRSFGKGLVQREMPLPDGSAVRLTISRYYTPTGRSIQRSYKKGIEDYYNDYYDRFQNGELRSQDSIKIDDSLKFTTPKGKVVYGGGGIIPDVFIPLRTNREEESLIYLLQSGFLSYFVFEQLDKSREPYNAYTKESFMNNYYVEDALVTDFIEYAQASNIGLDFKKYYPVIKKYIKANLAEQLFGSNASYQIQNEDDDMLKKVLEISDTVEIE
ncbi:S41 family peptidase [Ascidiimonas aurantiaca]|uniref:S41 family peptidase n=1 Tax=Ascidiimonas aurantiaca TaxID=1685432 RepID=UPI0030EC4818